ncbi:MAG: hypothetical protein ABSB54_06770 [Acidimicrobiales bacterium]
MPKTTEVRRISNMIAIEKTSISQRHRPPAGDVKAVIDTDTDVPPEENANWYQAMNNDPSTAAAPRKAPRSMACSRRPSRPSELVATVPPQ